MNEMHRQQGRSRFERDDREERHSRPRRTARGRDEQDRWSREDFAGGPYEEDYGFDPEDEDEGDDRGRYFRGRDDGVRRRGGARRRGGYEPFPYGAGVRGFGEDEDERTRSRAGRGFGARERVGGSPGSSERLGRFPGAAIYQVEAWTISGPFTGRGPKGYRRSDEQLIDQVSERLERHGEIDASEIEVKCEDGVITLEGKVDDRRTKREAEDCAEQVYGVRDVMNHLRIDRGFFQRLFGSDDESHEDETQRHRGAAQRGN